MTEQVSLYNSVAPLQNVEALVTLIETVSNREMGLPGMATYFGPSGFGKSTAATYAANEYDAINVEVKSCWTRGKLCREILTELSIDHKKSIPDMVDQIAAELSFSGRTLLIDEADYLFKQGMLNVVRDIYQSSETPIILIGEERLPTKLQAIERVHGRMMGWVAAKPACLADLDHLARIYCKGVELDDEFKRQLLIHSKHSIRRVCVNLAKVKELSLVKGYEAVSMRNWGDTGFAQATAPAPRRELA